MGHWKKLRSHWDGNIEIAGESVSPFKELGNYSTSNGTKLKDGW